MAEKVLTARHEPTDVGERFIWIGVPSLLVSVLALALLTLWLYPGATIDRTMSLPLPQYPNPQLQPSPREDMAKFYGEEMRWLNGAGWIDKAHGIAHIPISDAMRLVVQDGIPGWPASTEKH
ncbi:MAG TPA: hypothetical protein VF848_03270 [Steroidobacteraceae bacterium]